VKIEHLINLFVIFGISTVACSLNATIPTQPALSTPTAVSALPTNVVPSATTQSSSTDAPLPTATRAAISTPIIVPSVIPTSTNSEDYIDDRSTPITLITSYFNAVNRKEYLRAYSYWSDPATSLGTLAAFSNGYADTASTDIVFGTITGGAGAGQIYYTVPVVIKGTATNGHHGNYAACYVIHIAHPENFAEPPIHPMSIERGAAHSITLSTSDAGALSGACTGPDFPVTNPVSISAPSLNIDANNYIDNRSGPIETVSSYLNALNSKQYVRAYSYWQNPANSLGPYDPYANGYADTTSISVTFGTFTSDPGAGQLNYKVPLAMRVLTTSNSTQTFVGCFTLHLSQPSIQGVYPFAPLGITAGKFTKYNNTVEVNTLLPTACQ
jgi:hypothetical protein